MMLASVVFAGALLVQGVAPDTAVLYVSNRAVLVFRAPLGAVSPHERADAARRRIRLALEAGAETLAVDPVTGGRLVLLGGRPLFTITPEDADTAGGGHLEDYVASTVAQLRLALEEEREAQSITRLLVGLGSSAAALLILALLLRVIARSRRSAGRWLDAHRHRFPSLTLRGFTLVSSDQLRAGARLTITALTWVVGLFAAYLCVTYVLTRFPWSRQWGEALGAYLVDTLATGAAAVAKAIPDLFVVLLIVLGIRVLTRIVSAFFKAVEQRTITVPGVHPDTALATRRLIVALLWLFGLALVYPHVPGSDTDAFRGVTVFLGILVTLGSTGVIGQAMSGLVVMYTRALRSGEYVQIADAEGVVTSVGLLSTKIQTVKREEITIPSTGVLSQKVKNYSRLADDRGALVATSVTIGYDAPWRQVHALLLLAADRSTGVRRVPAPVVRQRALADFYVEYELVVSLDDPAQRVAALSELHQNIQDCFYEYGVQIMSPHYEGDKPAPVVVPKARWYAPPARPPAASELAARPDGA